MNASGDLIPPSPEDHRTEKQRALWAATHERIERFLPGFLNEVIPTPPPASKPAVALSEASMPSAEGSAS
jgi:brefeldin A-resistance guanine nucleotide exchange factor 1